MVREGLFDDVDAALTWHPEAWAGMFSTRTLANIQAAWRFTGTAAHAANSPHLGRSALDAVTLMTTGSNFPMNISSRRRASITPLPIPAASRPTWCRRRRKCCI